MVCPLHSTMKGEALFLSVHTCFLPSLLQVRCGQRKDSRWWSSSIPAKVCSGLQRPDRTPQWSGLGGAHTLVHTCTSSLRNVQWCESGGRGQGHSHFLLVLLRETCSVSGSSSVWVLFSCHLITFFTICQWNCDTTDEIIICSSELLTSDFSLMFF